MDARPAQGDGLAQLCVRVRLLLNWSAPLLRSTTAECSGLWTTAIDTTKLKSRGFATGKAAQSASAAKSGPSTLWTETPAERQQRLEDEMLGRKRKAENAPVEDESDDVRRKRLRDLQLRAEVERHNVRLLLFLARIVGLLAVQQDPHACLARRCSRI